MRKEIVSEAVSQIDSKYIEEAMEATSKAKRKPFYLRPVGKMVMAAVLCLCLLSVVQLLPKKENVTITAYASGSDLPLGRVGSVLETGKVNADGSMTGAPLYFYIQGQGIKTVRYSVEKQWISFMDWTEKRDDYGKSKNFTVPYGTDKTEYKSLVVNWDPDQVEADKIVLEIALEDGTTKTKAIEITVETDGTIKASFQDYTITDKDEFVKGKDATPVGQEPPQEQTVTKEQEKTLETLSKEEIEKAREAAINYYKETVFEVESLKPVEYNNGQLQFAVRCKKEGKYVDPDRMAIVEQQKGTWKLVAEGY